jgi:hypothetical protein
MLRFMNSTFVNLIHKKDNVIYFDNSQVIYLCNIVIIYITKIMASGLKPLIYSLIAKEKG